MSDKINQAPDTPPPSALSIAGIVGKMSITQMTLVVLVAIFLWQWLDGHRAISQMREELAEKIAQMDGSAKANAILIAKNQDDLRAMSVKVATLETYYVQAENQRAALEALYNNLSVSRDETALADVEQLLLIAGQQLQLSGNVKAALIAMESADIRLQRMERPAFSSLRKPIGQDIDKLRALPKVDISGINLKINRLLSSTDEIPLIDRHRPSENIIAQPATPAADEADWQKLLRAIWQEVKQLVRIENTGLSQIALLPPKQEFFLRENLKIRLVSARLALLSRDEVSYKQEIKTAKLWASRYFDVKSAEGKRLLEELDTLYAASIDIELPDISASLQAVRNYRLSHDIATNTVTKRAPPKKAAP